MPRLECPARDPKWKEVVLFEEKEFVAREALATTESAVRGQAHSPYKVGICIGKVCVAITPKRHAYPLVQLLGEKNGKSHSKMPVNARKNNPMPPIQKLVGYKTGQKNGNKNDKVMKLAEKRPFADLVSPPIPCLTLPPPLAQRQTLAVLTINGWRLMVFRQGGRYTDMCVCQQCTPGECTSSITI